MLKLTGFTRKGPFVDYKNVSGREKGPQTCFNDDRRRDARWQEKGALQARPRDWQVWCARGLIAQNRSTESMGVAVLAAS